MTPEALLVRMFQMWARTTHFDTVATQHSLNARDEMSAFSRGASLPQPLMSNRAENTGTNPTESAIDTFRRLNAI